jgi:hypothetical protein
MISYFIRVNCKWIKVTTSVGEWAKVPHAVVTTSCKVALPLLTAALLGGASPVLAPPAAALPSTQSAFGPVPGSAPVSLLAANISGSSLSGYVPGGISPTPSGGTPYLSGGQPPAPVVPPASPPCCDSPVPPCCTTVVPPQPVPEPSTLALLMTAMFALLIARSRWTRGARDRNAMVQGKRVSLYGVALLPR